MIHEAQNFLGQKNQEKLTISSIHKAKGLQWKHVILCDMTKGAFFANGVVTKEIEAAERRLFYVAITRAMEKLTIIAGTDMIKLQRWFEFYTPTPHGIPVCIRVGLS